MSDNNENVWISMGEAARQFGTSPKTLKRLLQKEQVPVLELTRNFRVLQSDIDKLKAARTRPMAKAD